MISPSGEMRTLELLGGKRGVLTLRCLVPDREVSIQGWSGPWRCYNIDEDYQCSLNDCDRLVRENCEGPASRINPERRWRTSNVFADHVDRIGKVIWIAR